MRPRGKIEEAICGCGQRPCRPGQRTCRECHAKKMKAYRMEQNQVNSMNTRGAFFRILILMTKIRERKVPLTAYDLAADLGVCEKTVRRDLSFLRDVGAPIFYDDTGHTWYWNPLIEAPWYFGGKVDSPTLPVSRKQILEEQQGI